MKYAVILYALAACFLTAAVTHCWTREAIYERMTRKSQHMISQLDPKRDIEKIQVIQRLSLRLAAQSDFPCGLAFLLAAPFFSCLYGAVSIHRSIAVGRIIPMKTIVPGMIAVFFLLLLLIGLASPC